MIEEQTIKQSGSQEQEVPMLKGKILSFDHIEVYNFKSFAGRHTIGPFSQKTVILGPNGGGKSSIFDSVTFCLASKKTEFKASSTSKLVTNKKKSEGCYVKIFCKFQPQCPPGDSPTTTQIIFHRSIDKTNLNTYLINSTAYKKNSYRAQIRYPQFRS